MHHVIYIPGVGDHKNAQIQINALRKWKTHDLEVHFHHIYWNDDENFKDKLSAILKLIDKHYSIDNSVSLIGVSAGASMAMKAFNKRKNKISAAIFICGKINNSNTLGNKYRIHNPRLFESVRSSEEAAKRLSLADKSKMLTLQPIFDGTVSLDDGRINGVDNKTIFAFFHAPAIYLSITLYRRLSINFIRSKSVQ
jgi:predicted peptidase